MTYKDTEIIHLVNSPKQHYKKYFSPNTKNQCWDFGQFCHVKCRVVKFHINNPDNGKEEWEVLLTNLNRFEFPILTRLINIAYASFSFKIRQQKSYKYRKAPILRSSHLPS